MQRINKKGFELSFNFIITAIILLIVMVVLITIFVGKSRSFATDTDECFAQGGFCARSCGEDYVQLKATCPSLVPKCCWDSGQGEKTKVVTGELFG